jgi:subtilisin family serine protease
VAQQLRINSGGLSKPELVAPSIWVVAPMLPGTPTARHATRLYKRRDLGENVTRDMQEAKLVTPHYKHVDGTSFAAPLISSVIACMLEANRSLTPDRIKELLLKAAWNVPGASDKEPEQLKQEKPLRWPCGTASKFLLMRNYRR